MMCLSNNKVELVFTARLAGSSSTSQLKVASSSIELGELPSKLQGNNLSHPTKPQNDWLVELWEELYDCLHLATFLLKRRLKI
jgi:hypothetical protein